MSQAFQVAPRPPYQKEELERNPARRAFIRSFPCVTCGSTFRVECAHLGPHGIGQKSSDSQILPLCHRCHQSNPTSYHRLGPVKFARAHRVDIHGLLQKFDGLWRNR